MTRQMGSLLLLDTSALLTLRDDEPGAEQVEQALEQPDRCYACFLSRMEVLYRVWKDEGERAVPGVNYVGGSRQLRRRVGAPTPLPWQGGGPRFCWGRLAGN